MKIIVMLVLSFEVQGKGSFLWILGRSELKTRSFKPKPNDSLRAYKTPCLSTPAESTSESSSVKIWSVKLFRGKKRLEFLPSQQFYITLFTLGKTKIIDSAQ